MPRPHKGPRYPRTIRFPMPLNIMVERAAAAAGFDNVNDYVVAVVSMAHEAGVHPKPKAHQEHLPVGA